MSVPALTNIGGGLELESTEIEELHVPRLQNVGGEVSIKFNYSLLTCSFPLLAHIGGALYLWGVSSCSGVDLGSLVSVDGELYVGYGNVGGGPVDLSSLEIVSDSMILSGVDGNVHLDSLGTAKRIWLYNVAPPSEALAMPEQSLIDGDLKLYGLTEPMSITMPTLETITEDLTVDGSVDQNPGIEMLHFPALATVGGDVDIGNNQSLSELPWASLREISGALYLYGNHSLSDISGLFDLETVGAEFYVVGNVSLPTYQAEALRDAIGIGNIGGAITIYGNAP